MILVTFALTYEGQIFEKAVKGNPDIRILYTGVGSDRAKKAIDDFLTNNRPSHILASGFAGGVKPDIRRGDLIVDFPDSVTSGPGIIDKLEDSGFSVQKGLILTVDVVVDSNEERLGLGEQRGALAVDMESSAIRESAAAYQIPVLGLRIVTDSIQEPLPVPPEVLLDAAMGKTSIGRLMLHLLMNPGKIGSMIRFAQDCDQCRRQLALASEVAVSLLAAR
ncbi:MAG: hypothetical protein ABIP97_03245 [Chthoniobacterales bacterium]